MLTLIFAAETGGSLTELAAEQAENATNFSSAYRYTHGTAAAMRRGSVVRLSESCDDTEFSGGFLTDFGDKPLIRLSAGLGTQRIGSGGGGTVWRAMHDTGLSLYDEYPLENRQSDGDECGCVRGQQHAAQRWNVYSSELGAGRYCDGVWK